MKRNISHIVVHCTAAPQTQTLWSLCRYFLRGRGWNWPGYHYVVMPSGLAVPLVGLDQIVNGATGYNAIGVHVAYVGGIDSKGHPVDNRTPEQKATLRLLIAQLHRLYPKARVCGHRDLPNVQKACPCFDVEEEYADLIDA